MMGGHRRHRMDAISGDHIVRKQSSPRTVRSGRRIIQVQVRHTPEIAFPPGGHGNRVKVRGRLSQLGALIGAEEECSVLANRPAESPAELVPRQRRFGLRHKIEEVACP